MSKKNSSRKRVLLLVLAIIISIFWGYFAWANYSTSFYYFPNWYESDNSVHLSITASGPNNSLDYYPGGYWVFVKPNSDWRRKLNSFWIKDPAVSSWESYSSDSVCDINGQPTFCVSMFYIFEWTDENGRDIRSELPAHKYVWQTWFVDVLPDIIDNAKLSDWSTAFPSWTTRELVVKQWSEELLIIKTYFFDDTDFVWVSYYSDISKKFVFRTDKDESAYIWVAHSKKNLWGNNWKVSPENMKYLNFATVHVKANTTGILKYNSWIWPNQTNVKILTVDMDNIAYDSTSRPELVSYIDIKILRKNADWDLVYVDKTWAENDVPFHRISLQPTEYTKNWKTIPGINTAVTDHTVWPSGSFLCNRGTIWTPGFVDCYNDQSPSFKWITQHTIDVPQFDWYQILQFTIFNASTYAWNAFAIAWNIDMFGNDVPIDDLLLMLWEEDEVRWITTVEVDESMWDWENSFDDDWKETKINYLHTYKTEICNSTQDVVNNVFVKLYLPIKWTLIWTDDINSSLFLNSSILEDPIDETKRLPLSSFDSQINLWTLDKWECRYLTYQVSVDSDIIQWDILKVKNEFSYNWWITTPTNEVENPVLALSYDASIELIAEPVSGSDVLLNDYITYDFTIINTWLTDIWTGSVVCGRFSDTIETECKVWNECWSQYDFTDFKSWDEVHVTYAVKVKDWQNAGTRIEEQCHMNYEVWGWIIETKDSNIVFHTIVNQTTIVDWWEFSLELYSRPKLLNTPDWNPRPDWLDQSAIKYTYKYTGSNHENMYPNLSNEGTYTDSRWRCSSITWPNKPNAVTYNIHSTSTSDRSSLSLSSNDIDYYLDTKLPNWEPKTTLYRGTLSPSHAVSWNNANDWYKNWGTRDLPLSSTEHRALVNGTDWRIEADITGTTYLDKWKYVPYDTWRCTYIICKGSWETRSCSTRSRSYTKYQWEMIDRTTVQFDANAFRFVTVWGSSAWLKTSNGHVHTNDKLTEDWTSSNNYDLWESWYTNVNSAPKLYAPVGSFHWDYIVSSNTSTTNLKSKKNWYIYNKEVVRWHWYVYDRLTNARDFYVDLIEKQKFWEVITKSDTTISRLDLQLNKIYYYPGNLTLDRSWWDIIVAWEKGTLVVEGNLYIKSNIKYSVEEKNSIKELPFLGLIVKWNIYIDWNVTDTVGSWHIDWVLHTWNSVKALRHLWNWTWNSFDFQRKAPEFYERDVNEPSEWIYFDDRIYVTTPPGFANLDEWIWSYKNNINQFTGEEVEW